MGRIRVLVVDDSLTVRKRLVGILSADPEIELVGEAEDGKSAIEICQRTRPDIITLDMMLPVMTGLAATEYIMAYCPTPILVVSSSTNRGELFRTYEALAAGAVDVLEKPDGSEADGEWERKFLASVRLVSRIRVITHPRGRLAEIGKPSLRTTSHPVDRAAMGHKYMIAAIGASTGGPGAIVNVLANLPTTFHLPIIFVLHINEPFGTAFADWLDGQTSRRVGYPKDGDLVEAATGRVVMAPAGQHLIVRDGRFRLTLDAERHSCRPSVDVLFESVAREYGVAAVACLLTGMGKDGAIGLLQIRQAGGLTIAQNEATSVIYGMPREAVILGAARHILPVAEIGPLLTSLPTGGRG